MKGMSQLTTTVVQLDVYVKLDIHIILLIKHLGHLNWYDFLSIVAHRTRRISRLLYIHMEDVEGYEKRIG
jgi:hypothetical protein